MQRKSLYLKNKNKSKQNQQSSKAVSFRYYSTAADSLFFGLTVEQMASSKVNLKPFRTEDVYFIF